MTTTGGPATGTSAGGVSDYASPAVSTTRALSIRADYLRSEVDALGGQVQELHSEVRERDLADRSFEKARKSVAMLLEELAGERGMSWTDIAEVVGVSVAAVRKWRKGGDASPDSRMKLAQIAALLDLLEEKGVISDPASWLEMEFSLGAGYFLRPLDLYLDGHVNELLELADERTDGAAQVLDLVRPNWRESRSPFEVVPDEDGQRSIRRRSE